MRQLLTKLRSLVWPARPDPAKSRRIAELRLVFCGFIAFAIIGTIGVRIVGLAEVHTNLRLSVHGQAFFASWRCRYAQCGRYAAD